MNDLTGTTPAILRQQLKVLEKQRKTAISEINADADKLKKGLEAELKDHERRNGKPTTKRLGKSQGQKSAGKAADKPEAPAEALGDAFVEAEAKEGTDMLGSPKE